MSKKKKFRNNKEENSRDNLKQKKVDRFRDEIIVSAKSEGQKKYLQAIASNDIVFCYGPAGSGKTILAVGMALQGICAKDPSYDKLIIMRPAREACDEHIGYLPGELDSKMMPWAAPIMDNMNVFIEQSQVKNLLYEKKVEILPLAYARGRSLNKSFVILDEAQNVSKEQMLLALTRIGKDSKMVVNGDCMQSDTHGINGLADAIERLQDIKNIAFVELNGEDVVRHPLIIKILERYGRLENKPNTVKPIVASLENIADPKKIK